MSILKKTVLLGALLVGFPHSYAQDYTYEMNDIERVYITANTSIILKAHQDSRLVIPSPENTRLKKTEVTAVSSKEDNTGFNVSVEKSKHTLNIESLQPRFSDPLIIYLPQSIKVSAKNRYHTDIRLSGFLNEIEIIANHGNVILENVSGPLILACGHGDTYISLAEVNQSLPMSIVNSHGMIDITLPSEAQATLELTVPRGKLYSEFKSEGLPDKTKGRAGTHLTTKLNGGGVPIMIYSSWGDVNVRKK